MLSTCKTDTLGTECAGYGCVMRSVCVGANLQLGILVAEVHQLLEVSAELSSLGGNFACINLTG